MRAETFEHRADDGASLFVYRWLPDGLGVGGRARAVVQLAHGMAEHAARYARLAEALTARGFVVQADDHRGHGKTARAGELGSFGDGGWAALVRDQIALARRLRDDFAGSRLVLAGHSMGSFLAQHVIEDRGELFDAVVLSGTAGKPSPLASAGRLVVRAEALRVGPRGTSGLLDSLSFGAYNKAFAPNRTTADWLSRDAAEVDAYVADPLCGFSCTVGLWQELLDALPLIAQPARRGRIPSKLPIYVFAGTEDPVGEKTKSIRELLDGYRAAGLTDVTHRFYEGARHETLNEVNRDEVTADLVRWLESKLPA